MLAGVTFGPDRDNEWIRSGNYPRHTRESEMKANLIGLAFFICGGIYISKGLIHEGVLSFFVTIQVSRPGSHARYPVAWEPPLLNSYVFSLGNFVLFVTKVL